MQLLTVMDKKEANKRATYFKETKLRRNFILIEDYTMLIDDLTEIYGKAQICEIAKAMGVSHVTAIKNVRKLIRENYLVKNDQGIIELTSKGEKIAAIAKEKYLTALEFLLNLGISKQIAAIDAAGIKHYMSAATLEVIKAYKKVN